MAQIRAFGQGTQIDQVKKAITDAKADGKIDRNEFNAIASEMNDVWKLNRIDLMGWVKEQDPKLANALRQGMAAHSTDVGFNHYEQSQAF
jgi:hypothetical protein